MFLIKSFYLPGSSKINMSRQLLRARSVNFEHANNISKIEIQYNSNSHKYAVFSAKTHVKKSAIARAIFLQLSRARSYPRKTVKSYIYNTFRYEIRLFFKKKCQIFNLQYTLKYEI